MSNTKTCGCLSRRPALALGRLVWGPLIALSLGSGTLRADLAQIEARGSLRVLMVLDLDGRAVANQRADSPGFDVEMLEGFAKLNHLKLEIVPVESWDRLVPSLQEGRGDLVAGSFTVTEARQKLIDFSDEVMPTRSIVVTRKPHRLVHTLEELRGERVTVFRGTSMADLLLELGVPASNLEYDVPAEGLSAGLKNGRVSCVVHDVQSAFVDQQADPSLQIGLFVGPPRSYAWGVRHGDARLLAALNEHIANSRRSGTWSRLTIKYFGEGALSILQKARGQ
jgi:membrane-bound lytic murein transglycosylase F